MKLATDVIARSVTTHRARLVHLPNVLILFTASALSRQIVQLSQEIEQSFDVPLFKSQLIVSQLGIEVNT